MAGHDTHGCGDGGVLRVIGNVERYRHDPHLSKS